MKDKDKPMIVIRADGNEHIGMGHLVRSISIARALEKQGVGCVFFVAQEQAGEFVHKQGFACEVLGTDYQSMETELPIIEKKAEEYMPDLWLLDSYQITHRYIEGLRKICPVFYLDDTGELDYDADGVINYNIYGDKLKYGIDGNEKRCCLLGAAYAPVKEAFIETGYSLREEVANVLITMGGSDKLNITGKLCRILLDKLPNKINITLICGRFNPHLQELLELQEDEERVRVLVDVPDMWNQFAIADVVVSAAGSTMYELSSMGVPTVCCYYVENQRRIAEGFAKEVCLFNGGDFSKEPQLVVERLIQGVCDLIEHKEKREMLSLRMKKVSDGKGAMRIAEELSNAIIGIGNKK